MQNSKPSTVKNSKPLTAAQRKQRQQREQRRIFYILIAFVLILFSLGTIFGCFLCSAFTPEVVSATETETVIEQPTETPVAEVETPEEEKPVGINCDKVTFDPELQTAMLEFCGKYDLPLALALAVAEHESKFNPCAISSTNDYGMMQINEINFSWLRARGIEPLDRVGNIEAGILMLSEAVKKHNDYGRALMAYNCGDAGAKRLWDKGVYSTAYSRAVMERFEKWTVCLGGN